MVEKTLQKLISILGLIEDDEVMVAEMCRYGGCYIFAKAFQKLFGGTLYLSKEKEHCIIRNGIRYYDSYGEVKDISGFRKCTQDDEIYMEDNYGLEDYYDCNMNWIIDEVSYL